MAARLREWDKLPPDLQKDLLANEATLRYFTEIEGLSNEQRRKILEGMSPARRKKLEEGIEQWSRMPERQRTKIISRFNQFFDFTAEDKEKALRTLPTPERRQIERMLKAYGSLHGVLRKRAGRSSSQECNKSPQSPSQRPQWRASPAPQA